MGGNNRKVLSPAGIKAFFDCEFDPIEHFKKLWSGWWAGADFIQHPNLGALGGIHGFHDCLYIWLNAKRKWVWSNQAKLANY